MPAGGEYREARIEPSSQHHARGNHLYLLWYVQQPNQCLQTRENLHTQRERYKASISCHRRRLRMREEAIRLSLWNILAQRTARGVEKWEGSQRNIIMCLHVIAIARKREIICKSRKPGRVESFLARSSGDNERLWEMTWGEKAPNGKINN